MTTDDTRLELFYEDGTRVPDEKAAKARMGKSGTVGNIYTRGPCRRCGGAGGWQGWPGFTCYRCNGRDSRMFESHATKVWTQDGLDRLYAARERAERKRKEKAEREALERHQRFEAWRKGADTDTTTLEALEAYEGRSRFLLDLQDKLSHEETLTGKQMEAARKVLVQEADWTAQALRSEHIGEVGERLRGLEVEVTFVRFIESQYGGSRLVKMKDADDNVLVTFATSEWVWSVEQGEHVRLDGTVKDHDSYHGTDQTILTRTKRVD